MSRLPERRVDKDPGWIDRRFRELDQRIDGKLGPNTPIAGGVVTVQQIVTNPTAVLGFIDDDLTTATADDATVSLTLTETPITRSLHVRQNGIDLAASEWTQVGKLVTIAPSVDVVIRTGDVFDAAYAFDTTGASTHDAAAPITFRDYSTGGVDSWTIPTGAVVGDLLIAVGMVDVSKSVTNHGWTSLGESSSVNHTANHGGPSGYTYRLVVLTTVWDGTPTVPTVSAGGNESTCLMAAFDGGATVEVAFSTLADGTSASTPAINPSSLRVWATIGNLVTIVPSHGTQVGYAGGDDIDIVMTLESGTAPVSASVDSAAGWCLASMVVR